MSVVSIKLSPPSSLVLLLSVVIYWMKENLATVLLGLYLFIYLFIYLFFNYSIYIAGLYLSLIFNRLHV